MNAENERPVLKTGAEPYVKPGMEIVALSREMRGHNQ